MHARRPGHQSGLRRHSVLAGPRDTPERKHEFAYRVEGAADDRPHLLDESPVAAREPVMPHADRDVRGHVGVAHLVDHPRTRTFAQLDVLAGGVERRHPEPEVDGGRVPGTERHVSLVSVHVPAGSPADSSIDTSADSPLRGHAPGASDEPP